ncbi:hypothetical protein AB0B45_02480 [Nonomuraea sp. NPDC049152]|uniref:hypothetical protein n=1 Tax=Nonomuraea sp. NPDC049152 TaxID=3154350 RepID=UPI0033C9C2CB
MSDDFDEIESAIARLPRDYLDDVIRAQREAASAAPPPPSVIPEPEWPYPPRHPLGGVVRFRCPLGCPWYHDENPGAERPGRFMLPVGFTNEDVASAITLEAEARGNAMRLRVEDAIAAHFAADHANR